MGTRLIAICQAIVMVIGTTITFIELVERPGNGAEKKQEVVDKVQRAMLTLPVPAWAKALFSVDALISMVIDMLVAALNASGWFDKEINVPAHPTPAPSA